MDEPQKHYAKLLAYYERSHTEKITYCMIPFMCNIQYRQIHEDRKQINGCQGYREGVVIGIDS